MAAPIPGGQAEGRAGGVATRGSPTLAERCAAPGQALLDLDLWAPVPVTGPPAELKSAIERRDWDLADELSRKGYGGLRLFGRQALELSQCAPPGLNATQDARWNHRAQYCGLWDELLKLAQDPGVNTTVRSSAQLVLAIDLASLQDLTYPIVPDYPMNYVHTWAHRVNGATGRRRRAWRTEGDAHFGIFESSRNARHRQLQLPLQLGICELWGGRLDRAAEFFASCATLGDEGDVQRDVAHDLERLTRLARGHTSGVEWRLLHRLRMPDGPPPMEAADWLLDMIGLISLDSRGLFQEVAAFLERLTMRLGSPKRLLAAESWRLAADLDSCGPARASALVLKAAGAPAGLRALPQLLLGVIARDVNELERAVTLARRSGNVAIQISALAWLVATQPTRRSCRHLSALLRLTGWHRPILVPAPMRLQAALNLAASGHRSEALIDFTLATGVRDGPLRVILAHLEDDRLSSSTRVRALEAAARLGTDAARDLLRRVSRESHELGHRAAELLAHRPRRTTLSDREIEVLSLARIGMTNRQIAARLKISGHTVARHVSNARIKLGAANRAEAVGRLVEGTSPP